MKDISKSHYSKSFKNYLVFEDLIQYEYEIIGNFIASSILKKFHKNPECLDVGCGTGRLNKILNRIVAKEGICLVFDYLDPTVELVDYYSNSISDNYKRKAINKDFADFNSYEEYDLIIANNSLCGYSFKDNQGIAKMFNPLRKDGLLIITLPSIKSDWVIYANKYWDRIHGDKLKKTRIEDLINILQIKNIIYDIKYVTVPLEITPEIEIDKVETIFNIMMYSDLNNSNFKECLADFKKDLNIRKTLKFFYGIVTVEKQRDNYFII